jgi:hypothetical protein
MFVSLQPGFACTVQHESKRQRMTGFSGPLIAALMQSADHPCGYPQHSSCPPTEHTLRITSSSLQPPRELMLQHEFTGWPMHGSDKFSALAAHADVHW